jgi:hypothetical protein
MRVNAYRPQLFRVILSHSKFVLKTLQGGKETNFISAKHLQCPNLLTQFSRKQAQNARFQT